MYHFILYLYQLGVMVYALFNKKVRTMWHGERQAVKELREKVDPQASYVWFHAASLGEFEQGRPLMEQMRREHPEYKILLTFFSPSGYEVRKNYAGADIITYLPIDTVGNARRFLRAVRPVMAFFIKYEFWYNYLHILKHRQVPVYSISSIFRPDQVFFKWYGRQYGRVLKCFTHFFVQNDVSRSLLHSIGLDNVTVTGDTRFDRVVQIRQQARELPVVSRFVGADNRVFVVGSSWEADEEVYLPYFARNPWKLIIAPHVVNRERIDQLQGRLEAMGRHVARYTDADQATQQGGETGAAKVLDKADVLLVDCYGLLSSIYRYGQVAYVGGGFGVSIHNLPEAAVWNIPVLFGPNNQKFQEAQQLKQCGGGIEITGADDFASKMDRFSNDDKARKQAGMAAGQYVQSHSGAARAILDHVFPPAQHQ